MKKIMWMALTSFLPLYLYVILATLAILSMVFEFYGAANVLILMAIFECLRVFCSHRRLSPFFRESKIPFVRCSVITQQVQQSHLKNLSCCDVFRELNFGKTNTLDKLRPNWTYITVTHVTIANILISETGARQWQLTVNSKVFTSDVKEIQRRLLSRKCSKCPKDIKRCNYRRAARIHRSFYLIIFHTSPQASVN